MRRHEPNTGHKPVTRPDSPLRQQIEGPEAAKLVGLALVRINKVSGGQARPEDFDDHRLLAIGATLRDADRASRINGWLHAGAWVLGGALFAAGAVYAGLIGAVIGAMIGSGTMDALRSHYANKAERLRDDTTTMIENDMKRIRAQGREEKAPLPG